MNFQRGADQYGNLKDYEKDFFTEEEIQNMDFKPIHDEVIFLIHLNANAFEKTTEDRVAIEETLKGFSSFIKSKIISSPQDKVGLVFYSSATSQNPLNFNGIDVMMDLEVPSASRIKQANEIKVNFGDLKIAEKETQLSEALWVCNYMFSKKGAKESTQRIFLFTTEDNPDGHDVALQVQAKHRAEQMLGNGVEIELFPLRVNNRNFDYNIFYKDIVSFDEDEANPEVYNPNDKLSHLAVRLRRKEFKKRVLGKVDFTIGKGTIVGAKFYSMVSKFKKPSGIKLDKQSNKRLANSVQYFCKEDGGQLYENQIGTYLPLGGEKVEISKEDVEKIKDFGEPSLTLLGFKPLEWLEPYYNNRSSYFLYPNDDRVENSGKFFDAMIEMMKKKRKIAIVRFIPKSGSRIRFGALLPQREKFAEDGVQTPPGLNLIFLPYADDLRPLDGVEAPELDEGTTPKRHHVIAAKRLVNAMSIDFNSRDFENPDVQSLYAYIQALALEEDEIGQIDDYLMPDEEGLKHLKPLIEKYKEVIYGEGGYEDPEEKAKKASMLNKRKKPEKGRTVAGTSKGRMEMEGDLSAEDVEEIETLVKEGKAKKLTKKEIVKYLKMKGLASKGTKAELIEVMSKRLKKD